MYRYSKAQHNTSLLETGSIRIGTLHDFRRIEHAKGISDPNEGKKAVSHHIDHLSFIGSDPPRNSKDHRALDLGGVVIDTSGGGYVGRITFSDTRLVRRVDHSDCFILCLATDCSYQTMAEFEGAETCVQIVDPTGFFQALTLALNVKRPIRFMGVHRVRYASRQEVWNGEDLGMSPALLKEPEFERQHELRALWFPLDGRPISPLILTEEGLKPFCRLVEPPEVGVSTSTPSEKVSESTPEHHPSLAFPRSMEVLKRALGKRYPVLWGVATKYKGQKG